MSHPSPENEAILANLRQELRNHVDEKTLNTGSNFFKETVVLHGVTVPTTLRIARSFFPTLDALSKNEVFDLCEELWKSGYMEESFVACEWSYRLRDQFQPGDFNRFERWLGLYVSNWASCDTLCNHTMGTFVEQFPEKIGKLKEFARSENRWLRRGAAVTLILPARKGLFLKDIFEIAGLLLTDEDDLVRKGYGWMLKAASQSHCQEVFDFVLGNKAAMPRTALRYAIEKMPDELRRQAMAK